MSRTLSTYPITYLNGPGGLGLVATGRRKINMGNTFDAYYPQRPVREIPLGTGDSYKTIAEMITHIRRDHKEAEKIARKLYSPDLKQFTKNIFDHIYNYFQYKPDPKTREQVKGVAGSYALRKTGIDCDDMAFLTGAILYNYGIPFAIRKIATDATGDFSHVYIVVPKEPGLPLNVRSNYYVIDPVVDTWDFEYPKNQVPRYYDERIVNPKETTMNGLNCGYDTMNGLDDYDLNDLNDWERLRDAILAKTEPVPMGETWDSFLYKVNLVINAWEDPEVREATLEALMEEEDGMMAGMGMAGMDGWLKKKLKKVGSAIKKVTTPVRNTVKTVVQKGVSAAKTVVRTGVKVATTILPVTFAAREGVKLWFRVLGKKKAAALWPGLYTEQQALALGIAKKDWEDRNDKWKRVAKVFEGIGGDDKNLAEAIYDGAKKEVGSPSWMLDFNTVWTKRVIPSKTATSTTPAPSTTSSGKNPVSRSRSLPARAQTVISKRPPLGFDLIRPARPIEPNQRLMGMGVVDPVTAGAATAAATPFIATIASIIGGLATVTIGVSQLVKGDTKGASDTLDELDLPIPEDLKNAADDLLNTRDNINDIIGQGENALDAIDDLNVPDEVKKVLKRNALKKPKPDQKANKNKKPAKVKPEPEDGGGISMKAGGTLLLLAVAAGTLLYGSKGNKGGEEKSSPEPEPAKMNGPKSSTRSKSKARKSPSSGGTKGGRRKTLTI